VRAFLLAIPFAACACGSNPEPPRPPAADTVRTDASRPQALEEALGWRHHKTIDADLNGDSANERIVLASDVTVDASGRPLWEDGHRWAVFAEAEGQHTLLYAAFVPNGHVEAAVLTPGADGVRRVLIHERTPNQMRSHVVLYVRPGNAKTEAVADYRVEQWLPALTLP